MAGNSRKVLQLGGYAVIVQSRSVLLTRLTGVIPSLALGLLCFGLGLPVEVGVRVLGEAEVNEQVA